CIPTVDGMATFRGGLLPLVTGRHADLLLAMGGTPSASLLGMLGIDAVMSSSGRCASWRRWLHAPADATPPHEIWIVPVHNPRPSYELVSDLRGVATEADAALALVRHPEGPVAVLGDPRSLLPIRPAIPTMRAPIDVVDDRPGAVVLRTASVGARLL